MDSISLNLSSLLEQIAQACHRSGRSPGAVKLLAVSKTFPLQCVFQAHAAGQLCFGENRVQELAAKAPLAPPDCEWHLIGHLQRNKVRLALEHAAWIQSVDSLPLLHRISDIAAELHRQPKILLEVNISGEASKFGLSPDAVEEMVLAAQERQLRCLGLMTIAPLAAKPAELGKIFADLRRLRDKLAARTGSPLPELSMGMSGDFLIAIAEGATLVRLGSAVFGHRPSIE